MARPSAFNRTQAIETAMQEIWARGYEATSVKAMSEKLGITRSSYYNAFGSREDLFRAALAAYVLQSPDAALARDREQGSIKGLLTETFKAVCHARASDPQHRGCLIINSLTELSVTHPDLSRELSDLVHNSAARLEELLVLAVERKELAEGYNCRSAALVLQSLLIGLNTISKAIHNEEDLWTTARTCLDGLGLLEEPSA